MIIHTKQVSTHIMDIPDVLDFHISLTYSNQSKSALQRVFGTLPSTADMLVVAFDLFRELEDASSSDSLRHAVNLVAADLATEEIDYVIGEWQCLLTAIVFLREPMKPGWISSVTQRIVESIEQSTGLSVHGAVSSPIAHYEQLPDAALEVTEAIQFGRFLDATPSVIVLSDWFSAEKLLQEGIPQRGEPDFTGLINQLIQSIHGKSAEVVQSIGSQCASMLISGLPRSSAMLFSFISFCGQLERMLIQFNIVENRFLMEHHLFPRLLHSKNEAEMRSVIEAYLQDVWCYYNQKKYSRFADPMHAAMAYIENNLTDPLLSISSISEALNMPSSTLTAQFKRFYGESIPNTIHKMRIAKIRDALLNTDVPIRKIAAEYGYVSIATFNRTFLKYEGMYPGAFRAWHGSKENGD